MINPTYINKMATDINSSIGAIRLNDSIEITTFEARFVSAGKVELEFKVIPSQTQEITNIKVIGTDNTTISDNTVYVPIGTETNLRHTITVKEVA